ncbi:MULTISPECIES: hypothetical protein [unclassified Pyramidobacter]|nr:MULTISPECIES: hypothetical protein [unclassified Pyramidobacter]
MKSDDVVYCTAAEIFFQRRARRMPERILSFAFPETDCTVRGALL